MYHIVNYNVVSLHSFKSVAVIICGHTFRILF